MQRAAHAAIIKDGNILILLKKETWILPGGKIEDGESDIECLCRELGEELPDTNFTVGVFYKSFSGITPNTRREITTNVYFVKVEGEVKDAAAEIKERKWVNNTNNYPLADLTRMITDSLKKDGYL
ncbi:MAG: NUDIX domain-containing protein [Nanoarchaeota archaeon]